MTAIYRDTRGAKLVKMDRFNHFPASPLVSVTIIRHGQLMVVPAGCNKNLLKNLPPLAKTSVTPPTNTPVTSWSPGKIEAITIGFFPDAWLQLGGTPDYASLPDCVKEAIKELRTCKIPENGWTAFCDMLEPIWSDRRGASWRPVASISDWARSLLSRAVLSGPGQSSRSFERYLKRLSGHTRRTLDFYAAFEKLHQVSTQEPDIAPADIAAKAGYADQSHMGRSVHRATGFSPVFLNRAIQSKEAFWCYRLLGQRF